MIKIHHLGEKGELPGSGSTRFVLRITFTFLMYFAAGTELLTPGRVSAQTPIMTGYKDFNFGSTVVYEPTAEKNQSKLWWNDGFWWGILWNKAADKYQIYRFEVATQSWSSTSTAVDNRAGSKSDVLWDGQYLYVVSNIYSKLPEFTTPENSGRLYRFSYDQQNNSYTLDSGFPVLVNSSTSETLTIDKDSRGKLWVTWTQDGKVKVNCTTGDDRFWGSPFDLPVQGNDARIDDISTIIAFEAGKIGIMWSNQNDRKNYFAVHVDGKPATDWEVREVALTYARFETIADDHIHLKRGPAGSGEVYAVTKTEMDDSYEPGIFLLKRDSGGKWTPYEVATVGEGYTRPILLIEEDKRELHVIATSKKDQETEGKIIRIKSTPLDNINFEPGVGASFIHSATDREINNATSTKQSINETTGMLVLAADKTIDTYFHNYLDLSDGKPLVFSFSPTEGSSGTVVSIDGLHFAETSAVLFNGIQASDFSIISDNTIEVTVPDSAASGPISVISTGGTATSSESFIVAAAAPLLTPIADQTIDEGVTADISVSAVDPNGDSISLSINSLPAFANFSDHGDGTATIHLAPGFEDAGIYSDIEVVATDDGTPPLSDSVVFEVTVNQINRKPLLSAVPDQIIREGDILEVEISASDPDGDLLTITVPDPPPFGNFSGGENGQGVVTFQPQYSDAGSYLIEIFVNDDGIPVLADSQRFSLTVGDKNRLPVAMDDAGTTAEDTPLILEVLGNDGDPDGQPLFVAELLAEETIGAVTIDPGDTTITYHPAPDSNGIDHFAYIVDDGHGGLDTAGVILTILAVNDSPLLTGLPDSLVITSAAVAYLNIWEAAEDVETSDRELTFHFMVNPGTLELGYDEDSGILEISAQNYLQSTTVDLVITVSDDEQESASHTIKIRIEPLVAIDPALHSIPRDYLLMQNYPNPFNPTTTIQFGLPVAGKVRLDIYNLLGERVAILFDEYKEAGFHTVTLDGGNLASGVYLYRIQAGNFQALKKMILMK